MGTVLNEEGFITWWFFPICRLGPRTRILALSPFSKGPCIMVFSFLLSYHSTRHRRVRAKIRIEILVNKDLTLAVGAPSLVHEGLEAAASVRTTNHRRRRARRLLHVLTEHLLKGSRRSQRKRGEGAGFRCEEAEHCCLCLCCFCPQSQFLIRQRRNACGSFSQYLVADSDFLHRFRYQTPHTLQTAWAVLIVVASENELVWSNSGQAGSV